MKKYLAVILVFAMLGLAACSSTIGQENTAGNDVQSNDMAEDGSWPPSSKTEDIQPANEPDDISTQPVESEDEVSSTQSLPVDELDAIKENVTEATGESVTITQSGSYSFSGNYSNITVNVDKEADEEAVYLMLENVHIESDTQTPINIIEAKDVVIVLEGENRVTQGNIITTDEDFPSGAIHSKADTLITGTGSLEVNTLYKDGINSRDDLIIEGATITVNAVGHGIEGKDLLEISNSDITVTSGQDGLKASNDEDADRGNLIISSGNFLINSQNDGISAEQILQIDGGDFEIYAGGGFVEVLNEITRGEGSGNTVQPTDLLEDSMRSIKGANIIINAGDFTLSSYEDVIHANGPLTINGGTFDILSGDDAIHADTDLVINDAVILVENAYEGIEGETVTINGGDIDITVLDDAINANSDTGHVRITGGTIHIKCQGDGIDSNGDLFIEGGDIILDVDAIYSGGDSEIDVSGTYTFSGGSVVDGNGNEVTTGGQGGGMPGGQGGGMPGGQGGAMPGGQGGTLPGGQGGGPGGGRR